MLRVRARRSGGAAATRAALPGARPCAELRSTRRVSVDVPRVALAAFLALTLAAPAAAADRCRPRGSERVAAEASRVLVLGAARTTRGGDDLTIYRACWRSTGRRTALGASADPGAASFRFAGRFVALIEDDALALTIADARRGRRLARSASLAPRGAGDPAVVDVRLSATGHAAWLVEDAGRSWLFARAGRRLLEVDRSTAERGLGALSLRGPTLRWMRGGKRRVRRLPPVA